MRLGLIVRADNGGLGSQTWELYRHLKPAKTLVVDISGYNSAHGQLGYDNYFERYTEGTVLRSISFPDNYMIDQFLEDIDVVLTVETPYNYYLFDAAREKGVKTVMQYNYEFLDYFLHPEWPKPDVLLAPSEWNISNVRDDRPFSEESIWGTKLKFLPAPVNRTVFPYKKRTKAKTFLHVAGHATYADRNGTETVLKAIPHVKSDVKFLIRSQYELPRFEGDYRVSVSIGDVPNYWELYRDEDVLILPRKYGGLSLQLNEAMSSGIVPLMLNTEPQSRFLHPEMLIEATQIDTIAPRTPIAVYDCSPEQLAARIDYMASMDEDKFLSLSEFCNIYSDTISWETLKPKYEQILEECLTY